MKIKIMSDLHLESCPDYRPNVYEDEDQTILVLAGDVCEIYRENTIVAFLTEMCSRFNHVIYVAGNHEFYNGHLQRSLETFATLIKDLPNISFLNNSHVSLHGINFIGCTLWTDMNKSNPLDIWAVQNGLNDFRKIRTDAYRKISPRDIVPVHMRSVNFIREQLTALRGQTNVVVTHHAPSHLSIHEKYKGDVLNAAYASDLSALIEECAPNLWVHGHMHNSFDYKLYETRVICNPKGYPLPRAFPNRFENESFNDNLVIEFDRL